MPRNDGVASQQTTVVRALELLDCLADSREPMSVAEITRLIGVSRSTTYRLLRTLMSCGYVSESFTDSDKLQIGPKVLTLATSFLDRFEMRVVARPFLIALRDTSRETVHLVVPHQGEVLHIEKVESMQPVRAHSPVGLQEPMHCSAVGKAVLAAMPEVEVDAIIRQRGLPKRSPNTITDAESLKEHLRMVRAQGFAINDVENEEGIRAIGVALAPYSGMPIAAISISGPAYRFTVEQACSLSTDLKNAAVDILHQMGLTDQGIDSGPPK